MFAVIGFYSYRVAAVTMTGAPKCLNKHIEHCSVLHWSVDRTVGHNPLVRPDVTNHNMW